MTKIPSHYTTTTPISKITPQRRFKRRSRIRF
nr:MAG TPA: hypothetical protein [Caudoviricetes sp.]